jgi:hypothetical protein
VLTEHSTAYADNDNPKFQRFDTVNEQGIKSDNVTQQRPQSANEE